MQASTDQIRADWIIAESFRLFPLDLAERIDWLYEMAFTTPKESVSNAVYAHIRRIRGM